MASQPIVSEPGFAACTGAGVGARGVAITGDGAGGDIDGFVTAADCGIAGLVVAAFTSG